MSTSRQEEDSNLVSRLAAIYNIRQWNIQITVPDVARCP